MKILLVTSLRLAALTALLALVACGGGGGGGGGSNGGSGGGGGGGGGRTISVLGFAPSPSQLIVKHGALYWLDTSDVPLNKLSLADMTYTPLFTTLPIPESAESDGNNVYWVAGGRLYKTPLIGSATEVLDEGERDLTSGVTAAIVMDSTHVYWANTIASPSCSPACTFTIKRVSKSGGTSTTLITSSQVIVAMAIAGGYVFWEESGIGPVNADGSIGSKIKKIPIAGGIETVLVNGLLNGLISPPSPGFIPGSWHPRGGIATDGSTVYFADADFFDSYRLMSVPVAGGAVNVMAAVTTGDGSNFVRDIELGSTNVYWVDATSLKSMSKAGGGHVNLASTLPSPVSLAYLGANLYWLETVCCAHGQKGTIRTISSTGGTPVTLKADLDAPAGISVDASNVFWVEGGSIGKIEGFGGIKKMPLGGGLEMTLVESADGGPFDVDDTYLYFADRFTIKRVAIAGGPVERVAIGAFYIRGVVTDGMNVYWVEDPEATVRRAPVNGGPITTLASGSGPAGAIRLDATHAYWMNHEDTIRRVPKVGGSPTTVVGPVAGLLTDFVVDGANVYFSEWDGARIRQTPVNGGSVTTLATRVPDQTRRLTSDGESVYWIDQLDLGKVSVAGGSAEFIVLGGINSDPFLAGGIAVDKTSVYWTEVAANSLMTATPK